MKTTLELDGMEQARVKNLVRECWRHEPIGPIAANTEEAQLLMHEEKMVSLMESLCREAFELGLAAGGQQS